MRSSTALIALFLALSISARAGDDQQDLNCGERCVCWLVETLRGSSEDLASVIVDFDQLDDKPGTTFTQVVEGLKRRGLIVTPYRLPDNCIIESDAPVVIHLKPTSHESLGHFAILLPTSTHIEANVWVGVAGIQSGSPYELRNRMSGEVASVSVRQANTTFRRVSQFHEMAVGMLPWLAAASPAFVVVVTAMLFARSTKRPLSQPSQGVLS